MMFVFQKYHIGLPVTEETNRAVLCCQSLSFLERFLRPLRTNCHVIMPMSQIATTQTSAMILTFLSSWRTSLKWFWKSRR